MAKKKRNYAAERREAQRHADGLMNRECHGKMERGEWLYAWGIAYESYLAGLRRSPAPTTGNADG
jgi:hypothetical protein